MKRKQLALVSEEMLERCRHEKTRRVTTRGGRDILTECVACLAILDAQCPACGGLFHRKSANHRYCSPRCQRAGAGASRPVREIP